MADRDFIPRDATFALIAKTARQIDAYISNKLEEADARNLAPSHGDILCLLYVEGEASMGEIAAKVARDPSTVTALVHKLVDLGYVEMGKDEMDRRVSKVRLTDKGRAFEPAFGTISEDLAAKLEIALTETERASLKVMLEKMCTIYRVEPHRR